MSAKTKLQKEGLIYEIVKNCEKIETSLGLIDICFLYELKDIEKLKQIYAEIKKKLRELEDSVDDLFDGEQDTIDDELKKQIDRYKKWIAVLKIVANDIKEEIERERRKQEIEAIKRKIEQLKAEKFEEKLKELSPEQLERISKLLEEGLTIEEAIEKIKEES